MFKMLPLRESKLSSLSDLPVRQRAPPPPVPPQLSLVHDTTFKLLYADNEVALRHFLTTKMQLPRENLTNLYQNVKHNGEPGVAFPYDSLALTLSAMRNYLVETLPGKQLLAYYRRLLKVQGWFIVTTAELHAFNVFVKMVQALFIFQNDPILFDHVSSIVADAKHLLQPYNPAERHMFDLFVTSTRKELSEATATATKELMDMKTSKEFERKHRQLLKAHEVHEAKLAELRRREQSRTAERRQRLQHTRQRNDMGVRRQMGMNGVTSHIPQIEQSVVEYVQETSNDFFPRIEPGEANHEERLLETLSS